MGVLHRDCEHAVLACVHSRADHEGRRLHLLGLSAERLDEVRPHRCLRIMVLKALRRESRDGRNPGIPNSAACASGETNAGADGVNEHRPRLHWSGRQHRGNVVPLLLSLCDCRHEALWGRAN